jgi:uroporphyrinogen decarboxylase
MKATATSLDRVLTALGHREPDRVPLFLLVSLHGARELGLSIREYFSSARNVVEGQFRLRARYGHDCYSALFYGAIEVEAWGGETRFFDDGPPNAGAPIVSRPGQIAGLVPPRVAECARLRQVLEAISGLKERAAGEVPVIGVAMSPYSVPVMQLGFERYLDWQTEAPEEIERLWRINEEFCVEWANAQLQAGATAICYFDPLASPTITRPEVYRRTGWRMAKRCLARIAGPTATHLASGRCLPVIDDLAQTGTAAIGVSALEDLAEVKRACAGRLAVIGNLNGIEMRRWGPAEAEAAVKEAIGKAARGGGFILSDNHGEIPWQVPDDTLMAVAEAVRRWGEYPLPGRDGE